VRLRGVEVIDNNDNSIDCPVRLVLNGAPTPIDIGTTVTYTDDLTPTVTSITPKYGKVKGG